MPTMGILPLPFLPCCCSTPWCVDWPPGQTANCPVCQIGWGNLSHSKLPGARWWWEEWQRRDGCSGSAGAGGGARWNGWGQIDVDNCLRPMWEITSFLGAITYALFKWNNYFSKGITGWKKNDIYTMGLLTLVSYLVDLYLVVQDNPFSNHTLKHKPNNHIIKQLFST